MKVVSLKLINTKDNNSNIDKFCVTFEDNSKQDIFVDIWYTPINCIKYKFLLAINALRITNIDDAYEMYVHEIAEVCCPWKEEDILNTYQNMSRYKF